MILNYVSIGLDYFYYVESQNELRYEFQKRTNFINDFFSKAVRKLKFKTDGTFNMISIELTEDVIANCSIVPLHALKVELPFDRKRFEDFKDTDICDYYLEILEQGFNKASTLKNIPLKPLLDSVKIFKQKGCKNEWLHKKKRFKKEDLEVILTCMFTTNYFQLVASFIHISNKRELVNGILIKTEAGVSIHEGTYKDVLIEDDIIITDKTNNPIILINKEKIFEGVLDFSIIGDEAIREILSYE